MTMKYLTILLALGGCVDVQKDLEGTQSLRVDVVSPTDLGSTTNRLPDTSRAVVVNLTAIDAQGAEDPSFNVELGVYAHYLGTLTPYLTETPLTTVDLVNGKATNVMVTLPDFVFGATTIWFDDSRAEAPTLVTGSSKPLWFRDPNIQDIQMPRDELALDALENSTLEQKQVDVRTSRHGENGRLVINSVFAQGYTVSDLACGPGGAPPCTAGPYDHIMVFSFSAPRYSDDEDEENNEILKQGQVISRFNGGVTEFNGLTEIGFPRTFTNGVDVDPARLPPPVKLQAGRAALGETTDWFASLSTGDGVINFERNEAAPIEINEAVVCALDDDWTTFKQWKLDPKGTETPGGADCSRSRNVINVISTSITELDPTTLVGKKLPKVIGVVRPVNIGSFNVWIVFPRTMSDFQLP